MRINKKVVNSMKVNYERAIKENNDLELKFMGINITSNIY